MVTPIYLSEPGRSRTTPVAKQPAQEKELVFLEDVDPEEVTYVPYDRPRSILEQQGLTPLSLQQRQELVASHKPKSVSQIVAEKGNEYAATMDDFVVLPSSFMDVSGAGDIATDPAMMEPHPVKASDIISGGSNFAGGIISYGEIFGEQFNRSLNIGFGSMSEYFHPGSMPEPQPIGSEWEKAHPGYAFGQILPDIALGAWFISSIPSLTKTGLEFIESKSYIWKPIRGAKSTGAIGDLSTTSSFDAYGVKPSQIESISEHNARILMRSESNTPLYRSYFEPYKTNPYQIESLAERNVKILNQADSMKGFADFKIETPKIDMGYRIPASSPDSYLSTRLPTAKPQPVFETIRAPKPYKPLPSESPELQNLFGKSSADSLNSMLANANKPLTTINEGVYGVPGLFLEMERYMQIRGLSSPDAQAFPSDFTYTDLISRPKGGQSEDPFTELTTTPDPGILIDPDTFPTPKITPTSTPKFRPYPKEQPEILRFPKLSRTTERPPRMPKLPNLKLDMQFKKGKRKGKGGWEAWITELTPEDPIKALLKGSAKRRRYII